MSSRTCSEMGCNSPVHARGWCSAHYQRWCRRGSVDDRPRPTPIRDAFERLLIVETDECVLWPHGGSRAYGRLGQLGGVHVLVCERRYGPRPDGMEAAHRCGVPRCMNYRHLRWATPVENAADRVIHGTHLCGERNPNARLTAADVAEIRALKSAGGWSAAQLAAHFGVAASTIGGIVYGHRWKDVA